MKIAITSVLIIKENILFLEEWIDYHLCLGFDIFYLYDNSKVTKKSDYDSKNMNLIPQKRNKYGVNYDSIIKLDSNKIEEIIYKIKIKYNNIVNFIEWSPEDENGFICYNQVEAHYHCLNILKNNNIDWCASIDIDEFIVIKNGEGDNIKNYINNLDNEITYINLGQIRFDSRFNNLNKLITKINKAEIDIFDRNHSNKYIYKVNNTFDLGVHHCKGNGKLIRPPLDEICFNHYKLNLHSNYKEINNINNKIFQTIENNSKKYIINNYIN